MKQISVIQARRVIQPFPDGFPTKWRQDRRTERRHAASLGDTGKQSFLVRLVTFTEGAASLGLPGQDLEDPPTNKKTAEGCHGAIGAGIRLGAHTPGGRRGFGVRALERGGGAAARPLHISPGAADVAKRAKEGPASGSITGGPICQVRNRPRPRRQSYSTRGA